MLAYFCCRATVAVQNIPWGGSFVFLSARERRSMIRRRHFLALLGTVSIVRSKSVSAQSEIRKYRVGLFNRGAPITDKSPFGAALLRGLQMRGYLLGRDLELESR